MKLFNFEITEDSYAKEPIDIPKEFADTLPKDYLYFLTHYVDVDLEDGNDSVCIKVDNKNSFAYMIDYEELKRLGDVFPKGYLSIADDIQFEGFIISTLKEDFGHVYYLGLNMYWDLVSEVPDEEQIPNIRKHAFHMADNFTEFCGKLYVLKDEDRKSAGEWFESH